FFQGIKGKHSGLFEEHLDLASFDKKMRDTLLDCLSFDWAKINPAIFGSMFQGVMDRDHRREIGAHYTTEENILKLINPLFMDELRSEFKKVKKKASPKALAEFHNKLASLKFLDPACGCGNFLIIAYRELRQLEHEVVREEFKLKGIDHKLLNLESHFLVNVDQFYGIEILSWPCQIAKTGMWLMDHLMNMEASEEFGKHYDRLPLTKMAEIVNVNALRMDWESVVPKKQLSYILGNPPFVGARWMGESQKADMRDIFGDTKGLGNIDYVTAWYKKTIDLMEGATIRSAFVSTNSITQGEQVAILWKPLMERGLFINFGISTFKWSSEAKGKAAVHCVIVGFSFEKTEPNINPYLIKAPTVFIERRTKPICDVPEMVFGSMPNDGGNLIIEENEYNDFIRSEPAALPYIRRFMGSESFINNMKRWCLWLLDVTPSELRKMPLVMERVEACRRHRLKSKRDATYRLAETPMLFAEIRQPNQMYVLVPRISAERRMYIPIGFESQETIASDATQIIPAATMYHFGIMTSSAHMAWMRAVCGRLKSDYNYSNTIVYNNFPWPDATDNQKTEIEKLVQGILDARARYPDSSLADLYDPHSMPPNLLKAHKALDKAVMKLYGFPKDMSEPDMVARLMEMYSECTLQP
ncbi:MAG: N-6 DNA methylase, partial [Holophagales bacterium]|nr:N-6 DNA methylase [Holophagales bacterium]